MVPRRSPRLLPKSQAIPLLSSDPPNLLRSAAYKVPYILPSYGYSNSFVFTLFTKLPGCIDGIPHFPFSLFHFRPRLSSLECAVPRFRALTPLECAVTKTRYHKSFRMRTYKKKGGGGWGVEPFRFSNFDFPISRFKEQLMVVGHAGHFVGRRCLAAQRSHLGVVVWHKVTHCDAHSAVVK